MLKSIMALLAILLSLNGIAQNATQTLMIKLKIVDTHYELIDSWLINRVFPSTVDAPISQQLQWQLLDDKRQVLASGWLADPQQTNGIFLTSNSASSVELGNTDYHHEGATRLSAATVIIRVPYSDRFKTLVIANHVNSQLKQFKTNNGQSIAATTRRAEFKLTPRVEK